MYGRDPILPTPDFSRAVEDLPTRQQNLVKGLYNAILRSTPEELAQKGWLHKADDPGGKLYMLRLHELRALCTIDTDQKGEYMILLEVGVAHRRT